MKNNDKMKDVWSRIVNGRLPPYHQMDRSKVDDNQNSSLKKECKNNSIYESPNVANVLKKDKKKRKGWKRVRHGLLMACRYIGMGASQMGPMSTYGGPDYTMDSSAWSSGLKNNSCITPHWTAGMLVNGW